MSCMPIALHTIYYKHVKVGMQRYTYPHTISPGKGQGLTAVTHTIDILSKDYDTVGFIKDQEVLPVL